MLDRVDPVRAARQSRAERFGEEQAAVGLDRAAGRGYRIVDQGQPPAVTVRERLLAITRRRGGGGATGARRVVDMRRGPGEGR